MADGTNLAAVLDGIPGISGALCADLAGRVTAATHPELAPGRARGAAAALAALSEAGGALGFGRLELVLVKGIASADVAALRGRELLLVTVEASQATARVEKALQGWLSGASQPPARAPPPLPRPAPSTSGPASTPPAAPARGPAAAARPAATASAGDPWAAFRGALVRAALVEAAAHRRALASATPVPGRGGSEPLAPAELDRALQLLLQGIGSVLAGDGRGGARALEPLTAASQRNLSVQWLARYWAGRAALTSGDSAAARLHLTQALLLAKQLDPHAIAASQWVAADVLVLDGDHPRAAELRAAARAGFERLGERWGLAQTWLSEARCLVGQGREREAIAAARQAWTADPGWEEPAVFLARRALVGNDLPGAEALLRHLSGAGAERLRAAADAIRQGLVTAADATEFLQQSDAPPSAGVLRAIERIARAAPRFAQAREALAWILLKLGKYSEASAIFRALLSQQLSQADRASVMLGLGCIAHAQEAGTDEGARLEAAVTAGGAAAGRAAEEDVPLPPLSASTVSARSSQLSGAEAVFSGRLSLFPLPDVVEFVRSARRTGMLVCSSGRGMAAVHFRDGRITGATAPRTPDLAELLLASRKVSSVALRALGTTHPRGPARDRETAAALLREGLVDEAALRDAARRQVELVVQELVGWKEGEFAFNRESDGEPERAPGAADLDAQDVLLTVLQHLDEAARATPAAAGR